jgi:predicted DNA-binding transcriptional regulator YafY
VPQHPGRDQRPGMERLVRLITILNASELGVRADTLIAATQPGESEPEAKRRALNRDIEHLNNLGWDIRNIAPIGDDGLYRMYARDNRLRVHLTPAQRGQLLRAAVAAGRHDVARHLDDAARPTEARPATSATEQDKPGHELDLAQRAGAQRCLIRFDYRGHRRVVQPVRVHTGPSGWYLSGREDGQSVTKEFVVARMGAVTLDDPGTASPVTDSARPSLDPLSWREDEPLDVTLEMDPQHLPLAENLLGPPATLAPTLDGTAAASRATWTVTHRAVFRWRVYELGTRVRVVSPPEMQQEIQAELRAILEAAT